MAQPNVSREPSMEEILASIRRIIESNEPAPARSFDDAYGYDSEVDELDIAGNAFSVEAVPMDLPVAANQPGPVQLATSAANRFSEGAGDQGRDHSNREPGVGGQQIADDARHAGKPVSLADLAARVRATSERREEPGVSEFLSEFPPAFSKQEPQSRDGRGASSYISDAIGGFREIATEQAGPMGQVRPLAQARIAEPEAMSASQRHIEALLQSEPVAQAAMSPQEQAEEADTQNDTRADNRQGALLSMQAGAQVAKSFEELAAVVDGQQRRSLDEIAQDMLRPMLQDWLDDNLPTLVERLVREEIERIARGPRR
ncbi:DUF2497 domain-containing protein [Agrobacterium vitis]|uniref:DUF2497 domain-containing protein n=1 Tax=Agrobacterium vitis TaxID=373 RepID=A0ABD6G8A5_AGRVI|nr:PopZ family protein [Agrobacterium vitis]MUO77875.1 DUF2497 domain-containing protein [Agrobacterium vitis]MUO93393.1 DUF2497 domain-containing protein [Agrobacterium vitis]MUP04744.1 DUF2497 domain-containing protein [Agrobacterium vitis]MUZ80819.1 DUF2497 domain-containing protein [Agrobacterium vitis]MVA08996.1 DUF2497 domain-containing protein [Agrobacterium vitis]